MWDVIWTDPNKELVGEHREKKARKEALESSASPSLNRKDSQSTKSSQSSESHFSFFRSRGRRVKDGRNNDRPFSPSPSSAPQTVRSAKSPLAVSEPVQIQRKSEPTASETVKDFLRLSLSGGDKELDTSDGSFSLSCEDSIFSRRAASDEITAGSLDTASAAFDSPALRTASPDSKGIRKQLSTTALTSATALTSNKFEGLAKLTTGGPKMLLNFPDNFLLTPPQTPLHPSPLQIQKIPRSPGQLASLLKSAATPEPSVPPLSPISDGSASLDNKATSNIKFLTHKPTNDKGLFYNSSIKAMRLNLEKMVLASPRVALRKLNGVEIGGPQVAVHEKLDAEQLKWFLSVLYGTISREGNSPATFKEDSQILLLDETSDTTIYLASLMHRKTIFQVSSEPFSAEQFPNIVTIGVPLQEPVLPKLLPNHYDRVYSSGLATSFQEADILRALQHLNQCLAPGGSFQGLVIDPLPQAVSLGYRLRAWLEKYLLSNLRELGICTDPSRTISRLLADASLRGPGSTLTTVKFFAVSDCIPSDISEIDRRSQSSLYEKRTRAELLSKVGRMLWVRTWGPFVTASSWWWEDQSIVDECVQLGTVWEYKHMETFKEAKKLEGED